MLDPTQITNPKRTPTEKLSDLILTGTQGFLSCTSEMILFWLALSLELPGSGRSPKAVYEAMERATNSIHGQQVFEELNYSKFRNAWYYLRKKGLISILKDRSAQLAITQAGLERLAHNFPIYLTERPWDKKVYLITYDIAEERKNERDLLREHLKRLGCAMLQASVYVAVYDPREILRKWANKRQLTDSIVVSDVGEDGSIAGSAIPELIGKLYHLDEIDANYRQFIDTYKNFRRPKRVNPWQLNLDWASCLEEDPQLPFALLPNWFSGEEAYQLYQKLARRKMQTLFVQSTKSKISPWEVNQEKYLREQKIKKHRVEFEVQQERGVRPWELG